MSESITDIASRLSKRVDESQWRAGEFISRYNGDSPLSFLSPEAQTALGGRLKRVSANYCKLAVDELAQRMRIVGLAVGGQADGDLWASWRRSGMVAGAGHVTKAALITGRSAVTVWSNDGSTPVVRPESALQCAWTLDPLSGAATEAMKRWRDAATGTIRAALYLPDRTVLIQSKSHVPEQGFVPPDGWNVTGEIPNPLGVPLLVPITNAQTIETAVWGDSEMAPLMTANDLLEKFLTDAAVNSETFSRPQRVISGLEELPTDADGNVINPFSSELKTWIMTEQDVKAVQLPSDFGSYDRLIPLVLKVIAALSGLPASVVGLSTDNPTSADAIAASGLVLTSRAEDRALVHDPGWSTALALQVALRDGGDPRKVDASVIRSDPRYSSEAAEADAVSKLVGTGLLSKSAALRKLGYSPDEISQIERDTARESAMRSLTATGDAA